MRAQVLSLFLIGLFSSHLAADWPQFRGPDGQGQSPARGLPLRWSEKENVRWKTPVPGLGWSSPVIAGGQVWLTTATDQGQSLRAVCLDAESGKLLRNVEVLHVKDPPSSTRRTVMPHPHRSLPMAASTSTSARSAPLAWIPPPARSSGPTRNYTWITRRGRAARRSCAATC